MRPSAFQGNASRWQFAGRQGLDLARQRPGSKAARASVASEGRLFGWALHINTDRGKWRVKGPQPAQGAEWECLNWEKPERPAWGLAAGPRQRNVAGGPGRSSHPAPGASCHAQARLRSTVASRAQAAPPDPPGRWLPPREQDCSNGRWAHPRRGTAAVRSRPDQRVGACAGGSAGARASMGFGASASRPEAVPVKQRRRANQNTGCASACERIPFSRPQPDLLDLPARKGPSFTGIGQQPLDRHLGNGPAAGAWQAAKTLRSPNCPMKKCAFQPKGCAELTAPLEPSRRCPPPDVRP